MNAEIKSFHLPEWDRFPAQKWIDAVPIVAAGIQDPELRPILDDLYALFPQPGEKRHMERLVVVERGRSISSHRHPEYTLVFYIDVGDPVVPIICGGEEIEISSGMVVVLPPNTLHSVPKSYSDRPRVSLALRWLKAF